MSGRKFIALQICLLAAFPGLLHAQLLLDKLMLLPEVVSKGYLAPAANGFGAAGANTWLNRAPAREQARFTVEVGFIGVLHPIGSSENTFFGMDKYRFSPSQAEQIASSVPVEYRQEVVDAILSRDFDIAIFGPTVTGSKYDRVMIAFAPYGEERIAVSGSIPTSVVIPQTLIDLGANGVLNEAPALPAGSVQVKLGTVYGTRAIVRFLPSLSISKSMGRTVLFGYGLEHNLSYWLPADFPVEVTAGFLMQSLRLGNLASFDSRSFGVGVSRTFIAGPTLLTPYVAFQHETTTMDAHYDRVLNMPGGGTQKQNVAYSLEGEQKFRFTAGVHATISVVGMLAEYSLGKYSSFAASLLFTF